ncbi:RNA polymerase sigma factor FliA [Pseudohalioglobus lutimaris]|uniref:RNA polymerase sigma factor FliA n=1 Tax=Pseudohalioglobus lutimaris TaxID=1737061 RepID=A0A2N5X1D9_9GAMM|nr:RNA polymerase sigma factor FliA [Pseudohalioglobus lutimaris]PLW68311.1 RNA polymerase sigma factor FliA [Pseudohalioglobus lutimaris]
MSETSMYADIQERSVDELVREYLPLVKKIGLHLVGRMPPHIELDDLMQVGIIGLMQASQSYDPSRGANFSTFAGIRIKGAMLDEVRRNNWATRSVQKGLKDVSEAISRVEARLGRSASDQEIAAQMGIGVAEYHELSAELAYSRLASLDDVEEAGDGDGANPLNVFEQGQTREHVLEAIQSLPEKETLMLSLYYGEELNLKEIGEILGVSESRVSQIHGQALARLRAKMQNDAS